MRKIIATEYITIDGVMEAPNKWSFQFWVEEAAKFKYDELFASDAILLGRKTYDGFAAAWPTMEGTGDFGERMNSLPKYVVSTTLEKAEWNNSTVIKANVAEEIAKIKALPGQDILLEGSADLLHTLMQHDLIDEYRLMLHPVVAGSGKRLFRDENALKVMKLMSTKVFASGIVILSYAPAAST